MQTIFHKDIQTPNGPRVLISINGRDWFLTLDSLTAFQNRPTETLNADQKRWIDQIELPDACYTMTLQGVRA